MSGRRIVGNLFFESELARAFPPAEGLKPRSTPSRAALEKAVRMGSLLRAFAEEGDRLWLPAPVDPSSVPGSSGLPEVIYETGPLAKLPACEEILAWGESPEVAKLRRGKSVVTPTSERAELGREEDRPASNPPSAEPGRGGDAWGSTGPAAATTATAGWSVAGAALADALWQLPVADPEVVARVHHRGFALEVARQLGCALPGARMVGSLGELEAHLRAGAPGGSWVVKAPFSASGRDRYIERGGAGLTAPTRRRIERLFEAHGPLLFEPWLERTDDFGACALLTRSSLRILGLHRQHVDARGQFAGIVIEEPGLSPKEEERFLRTVEAVGNELHREGYAGPFGIDAWRYRDAAGAIRFHPLGEINARLTFGFVARALEERQRAAGRQRNRVFRRIPPDLP